MLAFPSSGWDGRDLPPPADLLAEEVVQGAMVDDPLFDEATLTLPIPAQATPQTRWVRLTRLGPGDAPAACPTPWISLVFSTSPGVAAACPDGSPVAPWGCGDPPPADPETGFVVDDLVYEPLLTERDPDFYMTLDAYITIPRSCLMDDDCPIGEQCLGGDCTMFGGQVCDPACVGPANPFGWPEGCVYRLSQHPPPEASGPSFFEIVFGAIVTVWEYLAAGWNALVQGLVIAISVAIPGCEAACDDVPGNMACDENWCGSLVASVVHGAFVALGLPPHAPSFEQPAPSLRSRSGGPCTQTGRRRRSSRWSRRSPKQRLVVPQPSPPSIPPSSASSARASWPASTVVSSPRASMSGKWSPSGPASARCMRWMSWRSPSR